MNVNRNVNMGLMMVMMVLIRVKIAMAVVMMDVITIEISLMVRKINHPYQAIQLNSNIHQLLAIEIYGSRVWSKLWTLSPRSITRYELGAIWHCSSE